MGKELHNNEDVFYRSIGEAEERLKKALTSPCSGLIPIAPGLFVSSRTVEQIRADLERGDKLLEHFDPTIDFFTD